MDKRENSAIRRFYNTAILIFSLVALVWLAYTAYTSLYRHYQGMIANLIDLQCQGASELFVQQGKIDEKLVKRIVYCQPEPAEGLEENKIYPVEGLGKHREDYFVRIKRDFYLLENLKISGRDNGYLLELLPLTSLSGPANRSGEKIRVFLENGPYLEVKSAADYMALYKGHGSEQYNSEDIIRLNRDFWQQIEVIAKKIK